MKGTFCTISKFFQYGMGLIPQEILDKVRLYKVMAQERVQLNTSKVIAPSAGSYEFYYDVIEHKYRMARMFDYLRLHEC